jgi:hypothetical protein
MKLDLSSIDLLYLTPKTRRALLKAVEAVAQEINETCNLRSRELQGMGLIGGANTATQNQSAAGRQRVSPTNAPPPQCGPGETCP